MPRTNYCRDPDETARMILFGDGVRSIQPVIYSRKISLKSKATFYNYKKQPDLIPLEIFGKMARVAGLSDEEIVRVVRSYQ